MADQKIEELLNRFFRGTITAEEKETLAHWIDESDNEKDLTLLMEQSWQQFEPGQTLAADKAGQLLQAILQQGKAQEMPSAKLVSLQRRKWWRIAAAAAIIGLIGAGSYLFLNRTPQKDLVV